MFIFNFQCSIFNVQFSIFNLFPPDSPPNGSHCDTDDGGEEIEETVGQIRECGNAQHRALRQTAGVPWYEYRGYGAAVLAGTAEQSWLISHLGIHVFEHRTGEDDG